MMMDQGAEEEVALMASINAVVDPYGLFVITRRDSEQVIIEKLEKLRQVKMESGAITFWIHDICFTHQTACAMIRTILHNATQEQPHISHKELNFRGCEQNIHFQYVLLFLAFKLKLFHTITLARDLSARPWELAEETACTLRDAMKCHRQVDTAIEINAMTLSTQCMTILSQGLKDYAPQSKPFTM
jgi:hypothetical protein